MDWPTTKSVLEEMERRRRKERRRISEREKRHGMLVEVERARKAREHAKRRVENEKDR